MVSSTALAKNYATEKDFCCQIAETSCYKIIERRFTSVVEDAVYIDLVRKNSGQYTSEEKKEFLLTLAKIVKVIPHALINEECPIFDRQYKGNDQGPTTFNLLTYHLSFIYPQSTLDIKRQLAKKLSGKSLTKEESEGLTFEQILMGVMLCQKFFKLTSRL